MKISFLFLQCYVTLVGSGSIITAGIVKYVFLSGEVCLKKSTVELFKKVITIYQKLTVCPASQTI